MASHQEEPTHVEILGRKDIIVEKGIFTNGWIAEDLLKNVPASTYLLISDTNIYPNYVPAFAASFKEVAAREGKDARLLTRQIPPGETSKSRTTKKRLEDWMLSSELDPPCDTRTVIVGKRVLKPLFPC